MSNYTFLFLDTEDTKEESSLGKAKMTFESSKKMVPTVLDEERGQLKEEVKEVQHYERHVFTPPPPKNRLQIPLDGKYLF